jgi:hypothetical protein
MYRFGACRWMHASETIMDAVRIACAKLNSLNSASFD